jgi:hypothetical protein
MSGIDDLISKFSSLSLTNDNSKELLDLYSEFDKLTINCTKEEKEEYIKQIVNAIKVLYQKKRCYEKNMMLSVGKYIY